MLRKGSSSRSLWESPPVPSERYERRSCLCRFRCTCRSRIFFTIRQKRKHSAFTEGTLSWTAGDRKAGRGRERAWKDGGGEGGSKGGETSREESCGGHWPVFIHKPSHNAALALETLVLQMTNSHAINNILSIVMRHSVLFDRWLT